MKNLILSDCDGVLLNWTDKFLPWAKAKGYKENKSGSAWGCARFGETEEETDRILREFNESAAIGQLEPVVGSRYYVERLHKEFGFRFRVITSMGTCPHAKEARQYNLQRHFGDAIEELIVLDIDASKYDVLKNYFNLWWIEDKPANADVGAEVGLNSILLNHQYNRHEFVLPEVTRLNNWKAIYRTIRASIA